MFNNMFLCFFLIFLWSIVISEVQSQRHEEPDSFEDRIVGGWLTTITKHPYQVRLLATKGTNQYISGGSIISPRFILTAAHNIERASIVHVRAGSTYLYNGGTEYASTRMAIHPLFDASNRDYDVGLIDLQTDMYLDGVNTRTIKLPPSGSIIRPGMDVLVSGWGDIRPGGPVSNQLRAIKVPTVSIDYCRRQLLLKNYVVTSTMFCAGFTEGGIDACQGDSGGPAVDSMTGVQIGVVSWGEGCAESSYPGVYTDLTNANIRSWIKRETGI